MYLDLRSRLLEWSSLQSGRLDAAYDQPRVDTVGMCFPGSIGHHPAWHALHVWRSRFESTRLDHALDAVYASIEPRFDSFAWPGFAEISTDAWLAFAVACWVADLESASDWNCTLTTAPDREGDDYDDWLATRYADAVQFLCPYRRAWPPRVSCLVMRPRSEREEFILMS